MINTDPAPSGPVAIFGREPAWWLALIATVVSLFSAFVLNVSTDVQTGINVAAAALAGVITALMVHDGKALAAIVGFVQALLTLAVAAGFDLSAEKQALVLTLVTVLGQGYLRTQVVAPVPPKVVEGSAAVTSTAYGPFNDEDPSSKYTG